MSLAKVMRFAGETLVDLEFHHHDPSDSSMAITRKPTIAKRGILRLLPGGSASLARRFFLDRLLTPFLLARRQFLRFHHYNLPPV
jgi:hypothetical protein